MYLQAKEQPHPTCFSRDIAKICKLIILGALGSLAAQTQNDKINL